MKQDKTEYEQINPNTEIPSENIWNSSKDKFYTIDASGKKVMLLDYSASRKREKESQLASEIRSKSRACRERREYSNKFNQPMICICNSCE